MRILRKDLLKKTTVKSLCNHVGVVELELDEGHVVQMPSRWAVLNMICLQAFRGTNIKILPEHLATFEDGTFSKKTAADMLTKIYAALWSGGVDMQEAAARIFIVSDQITRFITEECGDHVPSIDAIDLALIELDPKIQKLKERIRNVQTLGSKTIENEIKACTKELLRLMKTPGALKSDALYPFVASDSLNTKQISQLLLSIGVRTDIDDVVIDGHPIVPSYNEGMKSIQDLEVESRSAVKIDIYSKTAVGDSQSMGKGVHLLTMGLEHVYPGSCGNTTTVPFHVARPENILGKKVQLDGQWHVVTKENMSQFLGKTVGLLSTTTCRCKNGICEECGGQIIKYFTPKGINVGMLSSIRFIEKVTQLILSAKHLTETSSSTYELSQEAKPFFKALGNKVVLKQEFIRPNVMLGIPVESMAMSLNDIVTMGDVSEKHSSNITTMYVRDRKGMEHECPMETNATPFLTNEMFSVIRQNIKKVEVIDGIAWVPTKDMGKRGFPVLRNVVLNASMLAYVKRVRQFIQSDIHKYTSISEALSDFAEIVYEKVNINIVHIENLLRALMVDPETFNIPSGVEDINNVTFANQNDVIARRSIGCQMAHERLLAYVKDPRSGLIDKAPGPLDLFLNIK